MITISSDAAEKVKELLTENEKTDHALRVFVRGMSCSGPAYGMALDKEAREDDTVLDLEGIRVLYDPVSAEYLSGAQIDYVDGLTGRGFTIVNPTAQASSGGGCGGGCACGK